MGGTASAGSLEAGIVRRRVGELRIIGGAWRSRRIRFPAAAQLRPTPDRVRETLFNWLGPWIEGRRVLDLFAGSGALGLEALSRGAAGAVFVEQSRGAAAALRENAAMLGASGAGVVCGDALGFLDRTRDTFDLAFVDPPYSSGLAQPALDRLVSRGLLREGGRIYVEYSAHPDGSAPGLVVPPGLAVYRNLQAGTVRACLLR